VGKRSRRGVDHPPPPSAEVKERVGLNLAVLLLEPFMACSWVTCINVRAIPLAVRQGAGLLTSRVFVTCLMCVALCRGHCDQLVTRSEASHYVCVCVSVCVHDLVT